MITLDDTKKLISLFVYHKFFIFNFYIAHWQHADLLRVVVLETKKLLIHFFVFTHLLDKGKQLLKAALQKRCS